jgi:hypothetical protein
VPRPIGPHGAHHGQWTCFLHSGGQDCNRCREELLGTGNAPAHDRSAPDAVQAHDGLVDSHFLAHVLAAIHRLPREKQSRLLGLVDWVEGYESTDHVAVITVRAPADKGT